jgi:hypothetical protein
MCGSGQTKVDEYVASFKAALNCDDECTCSDDDEPTLVIPIGSQNGTYTFTSSNGSLTLTETVVGQNTTVDYILDATIQSDIYSSDIVVGNTNITVVASGTAPSITYTVTGATNTAGAGIGITTTSGGGVIVDYKYRLANLLDSQFIDNATTGTVLEVLKTYTLPIGRLAVDAGRLKVKALFSVTPNSSAKTVSVRVNSTDIFTSINANDKNIVYVYFEYELYREDSTTLKVMVNCWRAIGFIGNTIYELKNLPAANITCNDLDAATNTINVTGDSSVIRGNGV